MRSWVSRIWSIGSSLVQSWLPPQLMMGAKRFSVLDGLQPVSRNMNVSYRRQACI